MDLVRPFLGCFAAICPCLQCTEDLGSQVASERTHLLADPVNNSPALRRINSDNLSNDYAQSLPKRDDQNALSQLVNETARNMIDVAAMDSHNLQHQEYNDRIKLYSQRLQQQWSNLQLPGKQTNGLLKDVPNADHQLSSMPTRDDLKQMRNFLNLAHVAVSEMRIEHKEAVVVPFRIP